MPLSIQPCLISSSTRKWYTILALYFNLLNEVKNEDNKNINRLDQPSEANNEDNRNINRLDDLNKQIMRIIKIRIGLVG